MNYRLSHLATIIGADEDILRDAARLMSYRIVGPLICFKGQIPVSYILEAQDLQRMKTAQQRRIHLRSRDVRSNP